MGKDKKKHKKHKKEKKEKKRKQTSSESYSSDGEWVEKNASPEPVKLSAPGTIVPRKGEDDDWGSIFSGTSTAELRKAKEAKKTDDRISLEVKPGQNARELNPYWKNGGTGLPPEKDPVKETDRRESQGPSESHGGSSRSFKRPVDDVDGPSRYGKSYEGSGSYRHAGKSDRYDCGSSSSTKRSGDDRHSMPRFRKPNEDDHASCKFHRLNYDERGTCRTNEVTDRQRDRGRFRNPNDDDDHDKAGQREDRFSWESSKRSTPSASRGWRKTNPDVSKPTVKPDTLSTHSTEKRHESSPPPEMKVLTSDELNALNAKIFRAELMGDKETVLKLKQQLENTRREEDDKTVILTQTDSKGFTRPVNRDERGSLKKRKVQTHEDSKRVRYFADDDDYSLQDMYEKEKYSSARDQEEDFMNLMGKEMSRKDGSLALDDPFEETASIDNRNKKGKQGWDRAVRDQTKKQKIFDECKWCLGAQRNNQRLIVKTKSKVYVTVPTFQSLTEGHCLIVPHSHVSCATQLDEDVWDEIMETRKELVRLFEKHDDQDVIFFETAAHLHKHPHMMIHCVPVPREIGDTAPIYFKKALLECESEWTNNKKVVDLAGKGVRRAVPKGLPYFFVDFGEQYGYAHVIEDQKLFPNNFAQEIIGGMMDLDHELWRKQRNVPEEQLAKNLKFLKDLMDNSED